METIKNKKSLPPSNTVENTSLTVFPNPFEEKLNVTYTLRGSSQVSLYITDMTGKVVNLIIEPQIQKAGRYAASFTPCNCLSGIYFLVLEVNGVKKVEKILKQ